MPVQASVPQCRTRRRLPPRPAPNADVCLRRSDGYSIAMDAPADPRHSPSAGHPPESANERHDRQLAELLNELRVALPGVQMLFGFLLAVPFSQRFGQVSANERGLYYAAFAAAAGASVC